MTIVVVPVGNDDVNGAGDEDDDYYDFVDAYNNEYYKGEIISTAE